MCFRSRIQIQMTSISNQHVSFVSFVSLVREQNLSFRVRPTRLVLFFFFLFFLCSSFSFSVTRISLHITRTPNYKVSLFVYRKREKYYCKVMLLTILIRKRRMERKRQSFDYERELKRLANLTTNLYGYLSVF